MGPGTGPVHKNDFAQNGGRTVQFGGDVDQVAGALGYTAVDDRYLEGSFWERRVEQPSL